MNRLFAFTLILVTAGTSFAEPAPNKESFLDLLSKSKSETKQMLISAEKDYKKMLSKLPPKERKVAMRINNLVKKETESPSPSGLAALVQLRADLREWQKVGSKKSDYQLHIIEGGLSYSYALPETNTYNERRAMNSELLLTVEEILAKEPSNSRAMTLKPRLISNAGGDDLQVIEAYRACVMADKNNSSCKAGYDQWVETYETLRCPEGRVKETLRLFVAEEKKDGPFSEKLKSGEQTFYTLEQPLLDGRDIQRARLVIEKYEPVILMEFSSAGQKKFEKATTDNVGKYIAIVLNGKAISVPRIQSAISGGMVQIMLGNHQQPQDQLKEANQLLNQMCSDPQSKKLPESLKL